MRLLLLWLLLLLLWEGELCWGWDLTILHTNDVHARVESQNLRGGECTQGDRDHNTCFGGAAKIATALQQLRKKHPNVIFLDGGDQYQGTIWFSLLKYRPLVKVMNALQYDFMALGNHEFDDGLEGVKPFIGNLTFPVISSNIDDSNSVIKDMCKRFDVKLFNNGFKTEKVGVVGYTTPDTQNISSPGPTIQFKDIITSLREAVRNLRNRYPGLNKVIAVGHAGITMDKEICKKVQGVDVVVGGHSNTFLYTGTPPSTPSKQGDYPLVFRDTGAPCLVVQDYAFGKYLGFLQVEFDDDGVVKSWRGNPILMDNKYPPDTAMVSMLSPYAVQLEKYKTSIVGRTAVALDSYEGNCRWKECTLGNLLTDAAVFAYLHEEGSEESEKQWTKAAISLMNAGGIRHFRSDAGHNLTLTDLYTIMPFGNTVEMIHIKGKYIVKALEESATNGKFLHTSGLKVVFDLSKPNGERVKSVLARCQNCEKPEYHPLEVETVYKIVTISYIISGNEYPAIKNNILERDYSEKLDIDVVQGYLATRSPLVRGVEGRTQFVKDPQFQGYCPTSASTTLLPTFLYSFALLLFPR